MCICFQADVFSYGIILCEIIARVQADPDFLPRTEVTFPPYHLVILYLPVCFVHWSICWCPTIHTLFILCSIHMTQDGPEWVIKTVYLLKGWGFVLIFLNPKAVTELKSLSHIIDQLQLMTNMFVFAEMSSTREDWQVCFFKCKMYSSVRFMLTVLS